MVEYSLFLRNKMSEIVKTPEQEAIIESEANTLVVNAFAGTGKTTTLIDYARARPTKNFVYLAFNRSVKEEAVKRFPRNVRCVTTHGLAYQNFGVVYKDKLGQPKPASIAKMLKCTFPVAASACDTVTNYLCSPDRQLEIEKHLVQGNLSNNMAENAFHMAKTLWQRMQETTNPYVRMPHDGYLKLYQLSNPKIHTDIIMVDEAQDSNQMVIDIVTKQNSRKLFIGDENQSIYGFRKAVDALNKVAADEKLYLTSSFRFGAGLANLATLLLQDWKGEARSVKGFGKNKTRFFVDETKPHAVLARTNSGLFDAAIKALRSGHPFGYMGGYEGYRLDMVLDAYYLKKGMGSKVTDPSILLFKSYGELESYAETVDDKELKMLIRVIDKYKDDIPHLIEQLKTKALKQLTGQEIILTTAHKGKGMEFESVVLLDDYSDLKVEIDDHGHEVVPTIEDVNILYVAVTRAISNVRMNDKTQEWITTLNMMDKITKGLPLDGFVGYKAKSILKEAVLKNK
jgi:F-box protein 18 (helicase)